MGVGSLGREGKCGSPENEIIAELKRRKGCLRHWVGRLPINIS